MVKKLFACLLIGLLVFPAGDALAGKKKKAKPYVSESGTIQIPHAVFYGNSGTPVNITIKELEARCAVPTTQGLDAYIFEVPAEWQKVDALISAKGENGVYDLDMFFFDSSCAILGASQAVGTDEDGYLPKGTVWVAVHNYFAHDSPAPADMNVSAHIEIKSL